MVNSDETNTLIIQKNIGSPSRVAINDVSKEVEKLEANGAGLDELFPLINGQRASNVYFKGDIDGGIWSCGQSVGLIKNVPSVHELIQLIVKEAQESLGFIKERIDSN